MMTDIEVLSFRRAAKVITDDAGPIGGETLFCDVPCLFQRLPHDDPTADERSAWFDLMAIDADAGSPIHDLESERALFAAGIVARCRQASGRIAARGSSCTGCESGS